MATSVSNKVIAITGAASGLALATAKLLASRGAILSLADLNATALEAIAADLKRENPSLQITTTPVDVRSVPAVDAWIAKTVSTFGRLDGGVNLAGVIGKTIGNPETGGVKDLTSEEWEFVIGINLTGVFNCMRAQLRVMSDGGSIVSASSVAGVQGRAFNSAYTAAKHGVIGLTRSAAKEVGERKIRVNAIAPGIITTPMTDTALELITKAGQPKQRDEELAASVALKRVGSPPEIAGLVAFLLGDESMYITGSVYTIDGGLTC